MSVFVAIASVTARALLGRRRTLLMLLVAAMPVLLGLLVRANGSELDNVGETLDGLVVTTVLPIIALVFGTAALGSELDDGTAVHILVRPIPRWSIVLPKWLVAGSLTAAMVVPGTILAGLLMGGSGGEATDATMAYAVATLIGSFLYAAIFLTLSVATSRGLIIGLAYSLIWEGLLSGVLPGSQVFSVREYLAGIASTLAPDAVRDSLVGGQGFLYAAVALVVFVVLAATRLSTYEVRGTD